LLVLWSRPSIGAERQVRPLVGVTFRGTTTFLVDLENAVGSPNPVIGVEAVLIGNIVGIEADVGWAPGLFESGGQNLVSKSGATTITGNVIVAAPRKLTEYTLRPYVVAGAGVMHVSADDVLRVLRVSTALTAYDVGGGVVGFLTNRVGVAWDVRRFGTLKAAKVEPGLSNPVGVGKLAFWRASMALVVRY
jgi:hypothetical protein